MRCFAFQVQFASDVEPFCAMLHSAELEHVLRQEAGIIHVDWNETVTTIGVQPDDAVLFWRSVRPRLEALSDHLIVVCEGDHGWDDYLLLHHFLRSKTLDTLDGA